MLPAIYCPDCDSSDPVVCKRSGATHPGIPGFGFHSQDHSDFSENCCTRAFPCPRYGAYSDKLQKLKTTLRLVSSRPFLDNGGDSANQIVRVAVEVGVKRATHGVRSAVFSICYFS